MSAPPLVRGRECDAAELFELIWEGLVDLLGGAATATLVRRSLKRGASRAPALAAITIQKDRFEYRYSLPAEWAGEGKAQALDGLRELARELEPLLVELTGSVVVHRLRSIPDLERCSVFPPEQGR